MPSIKEAIQNIYSSLLPGFPGSNRPFCPDYCWLPESPAVLICSSGYICKGMSRCFELVNLKDSPGEKCGTLLKNGSDKVIRTVDKENAPNQVLHCDQAFHALLAITCGILGVLAASYFKYTEATFKFYYHKQYNFYESLFAEIGVGILFFIAGACGGALLGSTLGRSVGIPRDSYEKGEKQSLYGTLVGGLAYNLEGTILPACDLLTSEAGLLLAIGGVSMLGPAATLITGSCSAMCWPCTGRSPGPIFKKGFQQTWEFDKVLAGQMNQVLSNSKDNFFGFGFPKSDNRNLTATNSISQGGFLTLVALFACCFNSQDTNLTTRRDFEDEIWPLCCFINRHNRGRRELNRDPDNSPRGRLLNNDDGPTTGEAKEEDNGYDYTDIEKQNSIDRTTSTVSQPISEYPRPYENTRLVGNPKEGTARSPTRNERAAFVP